MKPSGGILGYAEHVRAKGLCGKRLTGGNVNLGVWACERAPGHKGAHGKRSEHAKTIERMYGIERECYGGTASELSARLDRYEEMEHEIGELVEAVQYGPDAAVLTKAGALALVWLKFRNEVPRRVR